MEIDTELNEKRTKLQVYEKVEQELDEVVMQAAQGLFSFFFSRLSLIHCSVENDGDAEKVLFSYGYGASLPTSAKRRLQHSVHLAKRVIQLGTSEYIITGRIRTRTKEKK